MNSIHHSVSLNHRKYDYTVKPLSGSRVFFACPAANISQEFPAEDLAELLRDLPELILAEKNYSQAAEVVRFRVQPSEKQLIEQRALARGFPSVSAFIRHLALAS